MNMNYVYLKIASICLILNLSMAVQCPTVRIFIKIDKATFELCNLYNSITNCLLYDKKNICRATEGYLTVSDQSLMSDQTTCSQVS